MALTAWRRALALQAPDHARCPGSRTQAHQEKCCRKWGTGWQTKRAGPDAKEEDELASEEEPSGTDSHLRGRRCQQGAWGQLATRSPAPPRTRLLPPSAGLAHAPTHPPTRSPTRRRAAGAACRRPTVAPLPAQRSCARRLAYPAGRLAVKPACVAVGAAGTPPRCVCVWGCSKSGWRGCARSECKGPARVGGDAALQRGLCVH